MNDKLKTPYALSWALVGLMIVQAALGLLRWDLYRDVEWIKATWWGNDWVTLLVAVPLLVTALVLARRGSTRGLLLWIGVLGYGVYNYGFYMLGVAFNAFFPLLVAVFTLSATTLILTLARIDVSRIASRFRAETPVRALGGYFVFVAVGLTTVWMVTWAAFAFAGKPTPVEPEAFKLVAALDLSIMVPALAVGGILLWRRAPWGYIISTLAGVQGALYLLVLAVNTVVGIAWGLKEAPSELPVWGPLCFFTAIASAVLIANAERTRVSENPTVATVSASV